MKQEVILKPGGCVFSRDLDFLVGIVTHNDMNNIPADGVPIYYDLDDMNPMPFRLYKDGRGYYIQ